MAVPPKKKYQQTPKHQRDEARPLGTVEEYKQNIFNKESNRTQSMHLFHRVSRKKLPSLRDSSHKASKRRKDLSGPITKQPNSPSLDHDDQLEQGLLPEQIIAINNPDFTIHRYDFGIKNTHSRKSKDAVFRTKRNTSQIPANLSYLNQDLLKHSDYGSKPKLNSIQLKYGQDLKMLRNSVNISPAVVQQASGLPLYRTQKLDPIG